jgi:riboflavin synthase
MFTGIIQKTGKVRSLTETSSKSFTLEMSNPFADSIGIDPIVIGESIANNGVCLTVTEVTPELLRFDLAPETVRVTALSRLKAGNKVNLERALKVGERLSGHWVQGHVDGVAKITRSDAIEGGCYALEIEVLDPRFMKYCIEKGSFCLDGISLTIHGIQNQSLRFQIIPHTWKETALSDLYRGDLVNFEVDLMAKYIERLNHEHQT